MKSGLTLLLLILHSLFWIVILRHVPFFSAPLQFLDFDTYMLSWREILVGVNPYAVSHMFTLGPPLILLPYLPFALLPLPLSQFLFFSVNVLCGYVAGRVIALQFSRSLGLWLFVTLMILVSFPARFSLLMGQPALVITLLIALLLTSRGWVEIVTLTIFKPFFLWIALTTVGNRRNLIRCLFTLGVIIFAFSPLLIPKWYSYYLKNVFSPTIMQSGAEGSLDYYNQSAKSSFSRLGLSEIYLPVWVVTIVVLGVLTARSGSRSLAVVSAMYLSPVVWQHYMVFLFPVVLLSLKSRTSYFMKVLSILGLLLCSVQFPWLAGAKINLARLLASHMYFGMTIILITQVFAAVREIQHRQIRSRESLS